MSVRTFGDTTGLDDDFAETPAHKAPSGLPSIYDQVRKALSKPADIETSITLKVPGREGFKVRFSTDFTLERLDVWRQKSRKNKKGDIDLIRFNEYIIISQCEAIIYNDEEALDSDGENLTFRSQEIKESLGALDEFGAVYELYARDPHILRTGTAILRAAGYDDEEDDEADPLD